MPKALAVLAFAATSIVGLSPAVARANDAPVCSGSYDDYQGQAYADVGFYVDDFCTDPDGDPLTITGVSWGPGWQYFGGGQSGVLLYQIALGQETIPITVDDGQGNAIVFYWTVYRH